MLNEALKEVVETLGEISEMVRDGSSPNLTKFWHVETAKLTAETASQAAALLQAQAAEIAELREALQSIVGAKALAGVRALVAGWNGEGLPNGPYTERHPPRLGATLPKTDCGAVYELDEAMQRARTLSKEGWDNG